MAMYKKVRARAVPVTKKEAEKLVRDHKCIEEELDEQPKSNRQKRRKSD